MNLADSIKLVKELQADDAIGTEEIRAKLNKLLNDKYNPMVYRDGVSTPAQTGDNYVWLVDIYVFESYCVFQRKGDFWKHLFVLDPVAQVVKLVGEPEKVVQKFVKAPDVQAGGPGSGRKPTWDSGSDKGKLDKLHQELVNKGFKYNQSNGDKRENGLITHTYYRGDPKTSEGRDRAHVFERANGNHASDAHMYDVGKSKK